MKRVKEIVEWVVGSDAARYRDGMVGFWKTHAFQAEYFDMTPAGFRVHVRLRGRFERVDNEEFTRAAMLEEKSIKCLAKAYASEFKEWFWKTGRFFAYGWTNEFIGEYLSPSPIVWQYQVAEQDGQRRLVFDANRVETRKAAEKEISFCRDGCQVKLMLIDAHVAESEENFSMIDPVMLQKIQGDERYRIFDEVTAVVALKNRQDLLRSAIRDQTDKEFGTMAHRIKVKTELLGDKLRISWMCKEGHERSHIVGFRKKGPNFPEEQRGQKNEYLGFTGEKIVDSIENGNLVIYLDEGLEYAFTFAVLEHGLRTGTTVADCLKFLITVPRAVDRAAELEKDIILQKLEAQLEALGKPKRDPLDEKVARIVNRISASVRGSATVMAAIEKAKRDIQASPDFQSLSKKQQKDVLQRVDESFGSLAYEILENTPHIGGVS